MLQIIVRLICRVVLTSGSLTDTDKKWLLDWQYKTKWACVSSDPKSPYPQSLNCPNLPLIRKVWLFQGGHDKVIFIVGVHRFRVHRFSRRSLRLLWRSRLRVTLCIVDPTPRKAHSGLRGKTVLHIDSAVAAALAKSAESLTNPQIP